MADHSRAHEFAPRPLTSVERRTLDYLLSAKFPGVSELRAQAETVQVIGDWGDCCASVVLNVDRSRSPKANTSEPIAVEARSGPGIPARELLLFVREGWMTELEIVHYEEEPGPQTFPEPGSFEPPVSYSR
jgi:hypothetical protein